jgi:hypothetical protein
VSWIAITEAHLLKKISGPELAALRAAALKAGQADPVPEAIDGVTKEVLGYVGAPTAKNRLHADRTLIPDELLEAATAMIVMRFISRPAGLTLDPKGERKRQAEEAKELMKAVARGEFGIVQPETVTTEEIGAPAPSFGSRTRKFTDRTQNGI